MQHIKIVELLTFAAILSGMLVGFTAHEVRAEEIGHPQTFTRMPVKEVTVFKDGHAFMLHEGSMPINDAGNVVLDYLPAPVIGTFWPYSADEHVELRAVTASRTRVHVQRTALTVRELIEANVGAHVIITERPLGQEAARSYEATILSVPAQSGEELDAISQPHEGEHLSQKGDVVLMETGDGVKVVGFDRIQDVIFKDTYTDTLAHEEFRNLLTLKLDWQEVPAQPEANVGLVYLQKGIRWIPSYKVTLDGRGKAIVQLQATIINELVDLEDAIVHLVIGVPTFAFQDTIDPISLQETVAQLSQHFQQDAGTAYGFSNAIMSQVALTQAPPASPAPQGPDLGPEMADSGQHEDLFLFTIQHLTLKHGQRTVMPVLEFPLEYRDVYTLDVPINPTAEMWQTFNNSGQSEMAQLYQPPKVKHNIRFTNTSQYPLTTAPALILSDNRVIAQGMMAYTAIGAKTDLELTSAVDIQVTKAENETQRVPNAVQWHHDQYTRIDVEGRITLTSFKSEPLDVEITRYVPGNIEHVGQKGQTEMVNVLDDWSYATAARRPVWWNWFTWPYWWYHFNSVGRITWNVTLEPQKPVDLDYTWQYYWR